MVSRLVIADDAIDLADTIDHVIVILMLLNIFDQRLRVLLNRLGVGRVVNLLWVLGSVVYDADYLAAFLIAVSLRPARDRVIGAGVVISFVFRRNAAPVAPLFIPALVFGQPYLFRRWRGIIFR